MGLPILNTISFIILVTICLMLGFIFGAITTILYPNAKIVQIIKKQFFYDDEIGGEKNE